MNMFGRLEAMHLVQAQSANVCIAQAGLGTLAIETISCNMYEKKRFDSEHSSTSIGWVVLAGEV